MRYKEVVKMDASLRAQTCPKCGVQILGLEEQCLQCGETLLNLCESSHRNKGNARYCKKCGLITTFYTKQYLKNWKEEVTEEVKGDIKNEH